MIQTLKQFHCPNCTTAFCSRDATRYQGPTKFPLLLPCSHSVCEVCLHTAVKNKTGYICALCKNTVDLTSGKESIAKLHPDVHALGILNANRKAIPSIKVKMGPSQDMIQNLSPKSPSKLAKINCDHCCQVDALWQCDECQLNYCTLCFDRAHKSMKSKKKHGVKKIFAEPYNTLVQSGCQEHKHKSIEFYCEKDDTLTCSHCMLVGDHVGHEVKSLVDKNKSCAEDLTSVIQEVSEVEKRLKYTEHLLGEVTTSEKIDISEYVKTVHDHFHKLHSMLQLRENYLMSQLESAANLQNERFEKMMFEISGYQKDIMSVKRDAELVIENPCLAVSASYLLKKLESFKNIPCYLLPIIENAETKAKIDLHLDFEKDSSLENYGSVECSIPPRFQLVPVEDLPEKYCFDIPESFLASDIDSQSTTTVDNFSDDSLTSSGSKYGIEAAFKYRDFSRRIPEKVIVSHIKDPSCFWVQRCVDMRKLSSISDAMTKWCRSREAQKYKPSEVEKGDLYLVQFSADKKWYRGRVKRILEAGDTYELPSVGMKTTVVSKEIRTVKKDDVKIEVFYIDFGNTEVVSLSSLQNIQARFLNLAGLAKQCGLVDIAPFGDEWSTEAINSFIKFVSYKPVIMTIHEERNNIFQVDLSQVANNEITNDVPVSVRDALVFQEFAVFSGGKAKHARRLQLEPQFLSPERLRANTEISVIVSHVDSPSHFYIQQISTAAHLSTLIVEMNEAYKTETNILLNSIFAPRAGMICAAQFSLDKQWYRAQVKSLPGGAKVEVQYVDFGNTEVINHKFLRKLPDKFCKLNIQAIPCKLADVTFNQEKCWSAEAKEWLTNKVSKKQLTLKCLGFILGESKSEAVLFYNDDENEVCVNALMVEEGFAASSGEHSTEVRRKIEQIKAPIPAIEVAVGEPIERALSYESVEDDLILPPVTAVKQKPRPPTIVKSFPETGGKHIEVIISHIDSPGSFYVRIAGDMEKKLEKLLGEMQKAYEDLDMNVSDVVVGKSYAVFSKELGQWYRGNVLSKTEDKVKVQFVDYGMIEEILPKNLHKLMDQFTADEEFAIHCELIGIIPAGGSTQWSYKACEEFQDLVAGYETLHLSCKGGIDKDKKSLPVNLYIEELNLGGALEPNKIEYKNIATELVNQGLALPVRNTSCSPIKSENLETETSASTNEESMCQPSCSYSPEKNPIPSPKARSPEKEEQIPEKIIKPPKPVMPKFKWKSVVYPEDENFKGFVTNIGEDGSVHLHMHREGSSVVEMIKKALQFKYCRSTFEKLQLSPPVGEGCIAKFPIDNLWYRAEVLTIYPENPEKIKVNFVDYGNNEIIPLSDIRTDIIMQNFPKQCLECTIYGVHTGEPGQWDDDLLNFLHSQLVESIVEVKIMGTPDKFGKLPCHLVTSCGISVAELLMSMGFMDEVPLEPSQEFRTFQTATELREGDIFPVCVSHIDSPNIVFLQRLKIPEPESDYEKEHNKEHDAFLELVGELQDKAETFPLVNEPMPGLACCAKYSHDNQWYRCEVIDLTEKGAVVLYIDYGNSEVQPTENLRNPDDRFISFPMQIHFCKIHSMAPVGEEWDPAVKTFMLDKLCLSGQQIFARVVVPGKMSEIELMVKDSEGEMKRVYEELVEMKLVTLQENL